MFCGKEFITTGKSIRNKSVKSCGCYRVHIAQQHGINNKTHGDTGSKLYYVWLGIKRDVETKIILTTNGTVLKV